MEEIVEVLKDLDERLERARIGYMLVGSVLSGTYGEPRSTRDIDIVVVLGPGDTDRVLLAFQDAYHVQRESVDDGLRTGSIFNLFEQRFLVKVDLIVLKSDDYSDLEFSRRRKIDVFGASIWAASPEDSILCKLQWSPRAEMHGRDVTGILVAQPDLDWQYLEKWARYFGVWKRLQDLKPGSPGTMIKDTRPEALDEYYRRLRMLTNEDRARITVDTCSTMKKTVRYSLRHLPEPERTVQTFRRYYGLDLSHESLEKINGWIRKGVQRRIDLGEMSANEPEPGYKGKEVA